MAVPEATYRIKLYGYIGRDRRAFSEKLAAVLAIDKSAALALLDDVPTTVIEGMRESRARNLHELLTDIGALCLVEPIDAGASLDPAGSATGRAVSDRTLETPDRFSALGPKLWVVIVVGVLGAVLSFAAASILSSYLELRSRNRSAVPSVEQQTPIIQPDPPSRSQTATADALRGEIEAAERQTAHLKFLKDIREEEMRAAYGKYGIKPSIGREKMLQWEEARRDWEEEMEKLRRLRAQLDALEKFAKTE
ncbi:MAG: hypothetical protein HY914_23350 [Desulfomonile tiedjei]|nr:hypothetical protein [Desulfomonile tiedjei]